MDETARLPAISAPHATSRVASRRVVWHLVGVLLAATVAWLVLLAYRQPDFMLGLTNLRLC